MCVRSSDGPPTMTSARQSLTTSSSNWSTRCSPPGAMHRMGPKGAKVVRFSDFRDGNRRLFLDRFVLSISCGVLRQRCPSRLLSPNTFTDQCAIRSISAVLGLSCRQWRLEEFEMKVYSYIVTHDSGFSPKPIPQRLHAGVLQAGHSPHGKEGRPDCRTFAWRGGGCLRDAGLRGTRLWSLLG